MSSKDFVILSEIGKGSYSSVYKVKRISDGKEYALKKVRLLSLKDKEKSNALNEVRILASISNQYVISYKQAFLQDSTNSLCIVMEFAEGGDLQQKIDKTIKKRSYFLETQVWKIIKDILNGLKVLHDLKIVHRDIKTANIFISDGLYKLGDLNVSKILQRGLAYTQTGTPYYASPEVWRDQPYNNKSDIWSFGCVVYEICALRPPFTAKDMQGLNKKVQVGRFDRIPNRYSQQLQKFIQICLQLNPTNRPSCQQLLHSSLMKGVICQQIKQQNNLLDTIQIPRNLQRLKGLLPKSKYQQTQTTTQRIPSRRSDLTAQRQKFLPNIRKNGSQKSMFPELIVPNKYIGIRVGQDDYKYSNKKRQQGSYQISQNHVRQPQYYQIIKEKQKVAALSKIDKMNQQLEAKLIMRQRNLLGGLPTRQYSNSDRYKQISSNPVSLPQIQSRQRPAVLSLRVNNNRPSYQYNRPSWWG